MECLEPRLLLSAATEVTGLEVAAPLQEAQNGATEAVRGDFTGDGQADVLWRASDGRNAIWQMDGTQFEDAHHLKSLSGGVWEIVGTGDFDHDGNNDIVWFDDDGGRVAVWYMDGLDFREAEVIFSDVDPVYDLNAVGDMNGDGNEDLFFRHRRDGTHTVRLMNGTQQVGTLTPAANRDVSGVVVAISDFDDDGDGDLLWRTPDGAQLLTLYSDGSFQTLRNFNLPDGWQFASIGDYAGDTTDDILWRNPATGEHTLWVMAGTSIVQEVDVMSLDSTVWQPALYNEWEPLILAAPPSWDFTGDGQADILWRHDDGRNAIWEMDGTDFVQAIHLRTLQSDDWEIFGSGDFERDGDNDIYWWNRQTHEVMVWVMDGTEYQSEQILDTLPDRPQYQPFSVQDFNGDRFPDIQVWDAGEDNAVLNYVMDADTYRSDRLIEHNVQVGWQALDVNDFTANDVPDILAMSKVNGEVQLISEDSQAGTTRTTLGTPEAGFVFANTADYDQNGSADILWRRESDGANMIWLMDGNTVASRQQIMPLDVNAWKVAPTAWHVPRPTRVENDFNGDGQADILWRKEMGNTSIWLMDGNDVETRVSLPAVNPVWDIVGTGDFNGDNQTDILWFNPNTQAVVVWVMDGADYSDAMFLPDQTDPTLTPVGAADWNGDTIADILWKDTDTNELSVWIMNSDGRIDSTNELVDEVLDDPWEVAAVGDFNADFDPDIAFRNSDTGAVEIHLYENFTWSGTSVEAGTPPMVWQLGQVGDFDGDGFNDLAWRRDDGTRNVVWRMDEGRLIDVDDFTPLADDAWQLALTRV
ncbi:MAG: FG-GAP repeat domain-containing protein [Phycisphaerae bacterium]